MFEATFRVAILDGSGKTLVDQQVMATCGTGCRGTFDVTLPVHGRKAQWGTLRAYNPSAKDGSPEDDPRLPGLADAGRLTTGVATGPRSARRRFCEPAAISRR